MQDEAGQSSATADLVAQFVRAGGRLTKSVAGPIARRGREAIPSLIEILEDESLAMKDAPGGGHAPIHAVTLLRDLKATEAIEPMLRVLAECDSLDILYSALIGALKALGPPVLEPALAAYPAAESESHRIALAEVLSEIGVRDERIYAILLEELERDLVFGAGSLAQYGDPRALPHLSAALDSFELDRHGGPFANQEVIEIAAAIEELGGALTESQADKLHAFKSARAEALAPLRAAVGIERSEAYNARLAAGGDPGADLPRSRDEEKERKRLRKLKKQAQRRNRR